MSAPRVSIVLPLYNGAAFVAETLATVTAQTMQDAELLIVDDGSTDESAEIVARTCRASSSAILRSVRVLSQTNQGVAAARNAGIAAARAEWIAFLDQDDLWLPPKLAIQIAAVRQHPDAHWHYSAFTRFYADGRRIPKRDGCNDRLQTLRRLINGTLFIPPATALVRATTCRAVGGFDSAIIPSDDWDFFLKLAERHAVVYTPACLVQFRSHPGSTGKRQRARIFAAQEHVLQRHVPLVQGIVPARDVNRRFGSIYWHLGREAQANGDAAEARALFCRAVGYDPWRVKLLAAWLRSLI